MTQYIIAAVPGLGPDPGKTFIRRVSLLTGKDNTMVFPPSITADRIEAWANSGQRIQDAFPELAPNQREFLLSGATPEEWDEVFKEED